MPEAITTTFSSVRASGLVVKRRWTKPDVHPFSQFAWEERDVSVGSFSARVWAPVHWSDNSVGIVAQKYMRVVKGVRETDIRQVFTRVVLEIVTWGRSYLATDEDRFSFRDELLYMLCDQRMAWNSPVWFGVGTGPAPQTSACFLLSVGDTMQEILEHSKTEGLIFKGGSGAGVNVSTLRSSKEKLSTGGFSSGPLGFMRGWDSMAGAIKSGGSTRRAARMVVMNTDHPDIREFVLCKEKEEIKARALIAAGFPAHFDDAQGAYASVSYQNANHSVRASDAFMQAVVDNTSWDLKAVVSGEVIEVVQARKLFQEICQAAWSSGDPGMQFDDTCNKWNTSPNSGRLTTTNPCSEVSYLDQVSCNLASLNLLRFLLDDDTFDVEGFKHAVALTVLSQEILVSPSGYPTEKIRSVTLDHRPLGLGYTNLGALLMSLGLPYDSAPGRALAASITALMTGQAYAQSARIAHVIGPFACYEKNREGMMQVLHQHVGHAVALGEDAVSEAAKETWKAAESLGQQYGFRNGQISVLAPCGTIAFMMGCDTTGIEPAIALSSTKKLVGGGTLKMSIGAVSRALKTLRYTPSLIEKIVLHLELTGELLLASLDQAGVVSTDMRVFDCALGKNNISWRGHVDMMVAVQPFLSGAISKSVNLPSDATPQDVASVYMHAWERGLKAVAVYRDGCKGSQPVNVAEGAPVVLSGLRDVVEEKGTLVLRTAEPVRRRLPDERASITHKFSLGGHEGYLVVGLYPPAQPGGSPEPGEIFITMAKAGSTVAGFVGSWAIVFSMALQYGVPLAKLCAKFRNTKFEPSGWTGREDIKSATSIVDYIAHWLELKYVGQTPVLEPQVKFTPIVETGRISSSYPAPAFNKQRAFDTDAPPCPECGSIMQRAGACFVCSECGSTSGCS